MSRLRSLAFAVWYYAMTFVLALGTVPVRVVAPHRAVAYGRFWARLVVGGLRWLCGISIRVEGLEHIPRAGPALLASMHQSAFDTMVWMLLVPAPAYVFKQELLRIPLIGPMLRAAGMIPLDRSARPAAVRAFLKQTDAAVAAGRQIIIFPEGTRVPPGGLAPLQPGVAVLAVRTGLPVIPVATDSGRCWGKGLLQKRAGVIRIVVCPPLPAGLRREDLLARLRAAWDDGTLRMDAAVDNSVHGAPGRFPPNTRWRLQAYDEK